MNLEPLPDYVRFDPPLRREGEPLISAVIPAFNEARRIENYLREIGAYFTARGESHEILVVDDGSRDNTAEFTRGLMQQLPALGLLSYAENRGKGHAVRLGMLAARGALRFFADADGATPIAEIEKLRARIPDSVVGRALLPVDGGSNVPARPFGRAVAIGSRVLRDPAARVVSPLHRRVIAFTFRKLRNLLLPLDAADTQCGFKLFTAQAAREIFGCAKVDGLAFDVELLYLAARRGIPVAEVPVNWHECPPSRIDFWRDPLRMLRDVRRIRRLHDGDKT